MTRNEFEAQAKRLLHHFPGSLEGVSGETWAAWFAGLGKLSVSEMAKAVDLLATELDRLHQGTNLVALILRYAKPQLTESTVEDRLMKAHEILLSPDGDPYAFLRATSPKLCDMADRAGFFRRDITTENVRWLARDIAKRWTEALANHKRGFNEPPVVPVSRQLTAQPQKADWDTQREINQKGLQTFKETLETLKQPTKTANERGAE